MAKHRKTLKQKKIADLRHKFYSFDRVLSNATDTSDSNLRRSFDQVRFSESKNVATTTHLTNKYPYLLPDISKTGILTLSIIGIQLILFVLLEKHILVFPMVKY